MRFSLRLTVLFGLFLGLFAILSMRLWFVQIAEGAAAVEATDNQSWVTVDTPAPRGDIRDRNGLVLATSRFVPAVVVDRHLVNRDDKDILIQRLSALLAIPADDIAAMYEAAGVNGTFTVAIVDTIEAYQINEKLDLFPGVRIEKVPERVYISGSSMAHVIGQLGLPTADDIEQRPDLSPSVRIGNSGVEARYDEWLQGDSGEVSYQVRLGDVITQRPEVPATPGNTVILSLDSELEAVVENALIEGIQLSNEWKAAQRAAGNEDAAKNETVRGAAIVLDVKTGEILSMASYPSYDPSLFVGGLDTETYSLLADQQAFLNLAVSGQYPPASTFKAVTYLTFLEEDVPLPNDVEGIDPGSNVVHCDGQLELSRLNDGSAQIFRDWYTGDKGWLDVSASLQESCNIFFYSVALGIHDAWDGTERETVLQDMARGLGYGSPTGIDLTSDPSGVIPDRELFLAWQEAQMEDPEEAPRLLDESRLDGRDPWFGGDLMNAAIGQGTVSATPLQVAVSYAAMANGGKVWEPYVVREIRDPNGNLVEINTPTLKNEVDLDPANVQRLLSDLNRVVTRGTAASAFRDFGGSLFDVGGKTGTGQSIAAKDNHAWFAGIAPLSDPRYSVVVLIDEGGSGGAVAAPVGRQIMQYLMGEELDPIVVGESAQ